MTESPLSLVVINNAVVWNEPLVNPGCVDTWYHLSTQSLWIHSDHPLSHSFL